MSKIVEFIKQKCPDGVEYRKLGTLCEKIKNVVWDEEIKYYIDLSAVSIELHSILEHGIVQITKDSAPSRAKQVVKGEDILFGGTRPMQGRICMVPNKYEGYIASTGFNIVRIKDKAVLNKYVYHCMNSRDFYDFVESVQHGASYPAINDSEMKEFEIPVPPIEVQQEIVRILDKFTELEAGLQDELEARKKQYEYYSELLFMQNVDSKMVNVTEICSDVFLGLTTKVDYVEEGGVPLIRANNMTSGRLILDDVRYISKEQHAKLTKIHKPKAGDILVSKSGTLGVVCIVEDDIEFSIYESLICLQPNEQVYNRYLLHMLRSPSVQKAMLGKKTGNAIKHLNLLTFRELYVPLPSLEKQHEIANMLEIFEEMCNSSEIGLPAEIEARHKQYEYYRDKLLTFERKVV